MAPARSKSPEVPDGHTRCSAINGNKRRCVHVFPTTYRDVKGVPVPLKRCQNHRNIANRHRRSDKGKASAAKVRKTDGYKKSVREYKASPKGLAHDERTKLASKTPIGRKKACAASKRYCATEKGKANRDAHNAKLSTQIASKMSDLLSGVRDASQTLKELKLFATEQEATAHFELTFEPWMNWSNRGKLASDTLPNTVWQIGHRIAVAQYDHSIKEDVRRCWSRRNLFAQCARQNSEWKERLQPASVLVGLKDIWPTSWNGQLPERH